MILLVRSRVNLPDGVRCRDDPGNDARAVAALLKDRLGFERVDGKALIDLDRDRLNAAIERLREQGRGADLAVFYHAGHGIGGVANAAGITNTWLQPIGTPLASDADVRHRTISLNWLADKMTDSEAAARILIIDACRAGGRQEYCGGDSADAVAWSWPRSGFKTHPVAKKQANAWGLYDMSASKKSISARGLLPTTRRPSGSREGNYCDSAQAGAPDLHPGPPHSECIPQGVVYLRVVRVS
jgi:hypothetical protein